MSTDPLERYSRQMRFPGVGAAGQNRLLKSTVVVCGCGALGTVIASTLARAGIGRLRLVDRDFVENHNLQRQFLYTEADAADNLPKAVAAADHLKRVNSEIQIEPVVSDIDRGNIAALVDDADVIMDGTDNFEVRYLVNDIAVMRGKPWVFGGCVGSQGQTMTIIPGATPCLRCLFRASPAPGEAATCETAGVLAPIVAIVASYQSAEAIKILLGKREQIQRGLLYTDIWDNVWQRFDTASGPDPECPCCGARQFEWLEGKLGSRAVRLCGRNAVQIAPEARTNLDLEKLAHDLAAWGPVTSNRYLVRCELPAHRLTVFPDGRAIIQGTDDLEQARTIYARYIGH
jgi:adenylyltransferase/sulfurtransferase